MVEFINGNTTLKPADEPILEAKFKGLPGAEGTLKVAEEKPSKLDLFNAALAEANNGPTIEAITDGMRMVAEGVRSGPAILALAAEVGVDLPIVTQVVAVVRDGASPEEMAAALMGRRPKAEFHSFDAALASTSQPEPGDDTPDHHPEQHDDPTGGRDR